MLIEDGHFTKPWPIGRVIEEHLGTGENYVATFTKPDPKEFVFTATQKKVKRCYTQQKERRHRNANREWSFHKILAYWPYQRRPP